MPTNPPTILIPPFQQPVVAQNLSVEIKDFEGRVVDMGFGTFEEEETVVIDEIGAAVEVHEGGDVAVVLGVEDLDRGLMLGQIRLSDEIVLGRKV